jgi:hypothetical protein
MVRYHHTIAIADVGHIMKKCDNAVGTLHNEYGLTVLYLYDLVIRRSDSLIR